MGSMSFGLARILTAAHVELFNDYRGAPGTHRGTQHHLLLEVCPEPCFRGDPIALWEIPS